MAQVFSNDQSGRLAPCAESQLVPFPSPPSDLIRALESDLCSHPRASSRVVLVPQSPDGTPRSVHDAQETVPSGTQGPGQAMPIEVERGETIEDSSEDETSVRRVSAVLAGPSGRIQWDSDVNVSMAVGNEIVSRLPSEVHGPDEDGESDTESVPGINRRTRRRLSPWTSLICVSSPKCVYMCVKRCPSQTPNAFICVSPNAFICVSPNAFICVSPNAFICVSPNAFICVSPNASADATELASLAYLCSLRSQFF